LLRAMDSAQRPCASTRLLVLVAFGILIWTAMGAARFHCPCCRYPTLSEQPPGTFEICGICDWEDDWSNSAIRPIGVELTAFR
jgi:hypothetical protein